MHHGTHEKQLSNIFAWLLRPDASHRLGDAGQRLFLELVNHALPASRQLPSAGYSVQQEVDTSRQENSEKDIADIVLLGKSACIVIENFESSDGHGHDYFGYLDYGKGGGRSSVVVLLCRLEAPDLQKDGWEQAVVITYAGFLSALEGYLDKQFGWTKAHPQQHFFLQQLFDHFLERENTVNDLESLAFIKAMCESGESDRYGRRPQEKVANDFAEAVREHAKRQFSGGRDVLRKLKHAVKTYSESVLLAQLNVDKKRPSFTRVKANLVGQWEWTIILTREPEAQQLYLQFGPTAVVQNDRVPKPIEQPDYSKLFVTRGPEGDDIDFILQTEIALEEVLMGLRKDDERLKNALEEAIADAV